MLRRLLPTRELVVSGEDGFGQETEECLKVPRFPRLNWVYCKIFDRNSLPKHIDRIVCSDELPDQKRGG